MKKTAAPVHRGMMTRVQAIAYDFRTRVGKVYMPKGCCTDMSGAIAVFKQIDPKVTKIETIAGDVLDTVYRRTEKKWTAK